MLCYGIVQPVSLGNPAHANRLRLLNFLANMLDMTPHLIAFNYQKLPKNFHNYRKHQHQQLIAALDRNILTVKIHFAHIT